MHRVVYLSNSRDYNEQSPALQESFVAFVLLEKDNNEK